MLRKKAYSTRLTLALCLLCCISSSNLWAERPNNQHSSKVLKNFFTSIIDKTRYHRRNWKAYLQLFVCILICWPASEYYTNRIVQHYYYYKMPSNTTEHTPSKNWWWIILAMGFLLVLLGVIYRKQRSRGGE